MKVYRQVPEDAEYREYYDSYRITVDNLNSTDFLYKSMLSNGQVFFDSDEIYGFVNNQAAVRGRNLTITREYIDNFVIRDFKVFTRNTNDLIDININCNLKDYRDGKPHYLYIVLSHRGKYEVHDDMFQSDDTKIVFARFIIDTQGNSRQFYMMLPFAGSADYIKGNQFYQVTDGLRVEVVNNNTRQMTLTNAKIRFSGINFDDVASPDCLEIDFDEAAVPIRYCNWDSTSLVPRVDWNMVPRDNLDLTKVINYETGAMRNVASGKWSIQKLYFDVYEKCIVALYGNEIYNTREEAILSIDSVMSYKLPDGIEYLIPIAAIIAENTTDSLSEDNFRIVNLDYNEKEILDSDTFTRQQAAEAIYKANQALNKSVETDEALTNHTGDRTNPHRVRLDQLYKSDGTPGGLSDDYSSWTVSSIIAKASQDASNIYYRKDGGTISGNVLIGSAQSAKNLTVYGTSTLQGNTSVGGNLALSGNLTTNNNVDLGTASARFGTAYLQSLNTSSDSSISGTLTSRDILPETTTTYNLGSEDKRFNNIYAKDINASGTVTIGTQLKVLNSSNQTMFSTAADGSRIYFNKPITCWSNFYVSSSSIQIGSYSLRLGGSGSISTSTGYGIW